MRKIICAVSWTLAITGAVLTIISTSVIDNTVLFCAGLGGLALGIIGALITGKGAWEAVLRLLDYL